MKLLTIRTKVEKKKQELPRAYVRWLKGRGDGNAGPENDGPSSKAGTMKYDLAKRHCS